MEKVAGIGGMFFRARDPEALMAWYTGHLGIDIADAVWQQAGGPTVFCPFKQDTTYFGRAEQQWMVNFRVRDLDAMLAQLRGQGVPVETRPDEWDSGAGRFARLHDPEGNPVELWEPASPPAHEVATSASTHPGRCLCGDIAYEAGGPSVFMANCHCRDCQRASGTGSAPVMMFPAAKVEVSGSPIWFRSTGDSGSGIERGFCGRCGSQLLVRLDAIPGLLGVRPGTLDDPSPYRPAMDFHVAGAQPWSPMDPSIPKKPGAPSQ